MLAEKESIVGLGSGSKNVGVRGRLTQSWCPLSVGWTGTASLGRLDSWIFCWTIFVL